jgi:3-hydroxyisobutyrate dehydrogenase-like beta-hydroxyacid dehydrogenase
MHDRPTFAFIGFGEAAQGMTPGLLAGGVGQVRAYDLKFGDAGAGPPLKAKAEALGVAAHDHMEAALAGADVVISAVVADATLSAARAAAPHLAGGQAYLDVNSASPALKREAAAAIAASGAVYVDAGIMDRVVKHGAAAPMVVSGADAGALAKRLNALGMRLEAVGNEVGQASALKMLRGVLIKGLGSLFVEALVAAQRLGVADKVIADIQKTIPGTDWRELATYHLGRVVLHARRRAAEMAEVAATLSEIGIEPLMADAATRREAWCASLELLDRFPEGIPDDMGAILAAFDAAARECEH